MAILKNLVKKNAQRLLSFKIGVVVNLSKRNYSSNNSGSKLLPF